MFAGYDRYRAHFNRQIFEHVPEWARKLYRTRIYPRLPNRIQERKFSYNVALPWQERYVDGLCFVPAFERETPLLSDGFRDVLRRSDDPGNVLRRCFAKAPAKDPISKMLYVDAKTYMVGDILTKVDRMSMLNSLEVRVPLLDHAFVEYAASLPAEWKFRDGVQKYILRRLADRVGVPHEVIHREKQGFALPLVHWMRNEMRDMLMLLLEPRTLQRGYFVAEGVRKLMDDHLHRGRPTTGRLWRLLMFELWHRNFLERFASRPGCASLAVADDGAVRQVPSSPPGLGGVPAED